MADSGTTLAGVLSTFTEKPVLLWFTGNDSTDALSADERLVIINHLAAGGNAIITGQSIAEFSNPGDSLIEGYLGIGQNGNYSGAQLVRGFPGDIIGDGIIFQLAGGADNQTSIDILSIIGGSVGTPTKTLYYGVVLADTVNIAAVRVLGPGAGWGATYYGFGLEALTPARLDTLIVRSIRYFDRTVVGVSEPTVATVPDEFSLAQNYPNPFNPSTTIRYELPERAIVSLKIYNVLGQEVATLVNEEEEPGSYQVRFDGKGLASGIYLYRLQAGDYFETKKLVLLK